MGLIKNAINFGNGFNIGAVAPIDSRMRVESVSDLTSVWTAEIPAYKGMIVTVMETSEVYVLKDADNYTSIDSWVKLGSASGTANALEQAKVYTNQKVNDLATGAVQSNTNAIATLNAGANTEGSVAYAVAAETTRAQGEELRLNNAIAAETAAREAAINALDATVGGTAIAEGKHVAVQVVEENGKLTSLTVNENDIASAQALATEKKSREDDDKAINAKIGTVGAGTTLVGMINAEAERAEGAEGRLATRVTANENAIKILKGNATTEGSVAYAVAAEQRRAEGKEVELLTAINNEATSRDAADTALSNRLTVIEGEDEGSIKKAIADIKGTLGEADAKTLAALNDRIDDVITDAKTYSIAKATKSEVALLGTNVKEAYKLVDEDKVRVGEFIPVYKDSSLKSVALDGQILKFTYILSDGSEDIVGVDVSTFLAESEFANGLQVVNHIVSVKVDATSEDFLTVGDGGVKLSGVQTAINNAINAETQNRTNAINALNATAGTQAVSEGKHVAVQVVETAGKLTNVTVTEKDIASAKELDALETAVGDGFSAEKTVAKSIADNTKAINDEANTRKADDDAINAKIGTVGTGTTVVAMIEEAKAAAIAASTVVAENSDFITVTKTGEVGKTQTYTITTQDVASATATTKAINDEKARAKAAEQANASAIADEKTRAEAAEQANASAIAAEKTRAEKAESGLSSRLATVEGDYVKSVEAAKGSMITVAETGQKVTLSLQWGTF